MKRFRIKNNSFFIYIIIIIILISIYFLYLYNKYLSPKLINIAVSRIDELTTIYIKKDIIPPDINIDSLVIINKNSKDEINYIDINNTYANEIMSEVVSKIQINIKNLEKGKDKSGEIKNINDVLYVELPLGLAFNGSLFSYYGPKIPLKLSFYENAIGNIEVSINNYGINNSLLKIYLIIEIEQKINVPYQVKKINKKYELLLASKVIVGNVPSFYGSTLSNSSNLFNN